MGNLGTVSDVPFRYLPEGSYPLLDESNTSKGGRNDEVGQHEMCFAPCLGESFLGAEPSTINGQNESMV